jgi:hypothetical protein
MARTAARLPLLLLVLGTTLAPACLSSAAASPAPAIAPQLAQAGPLRTGVIPIEEPVIRDRRFTTAANDLVQILLADGTTFTIGPNSELSIDSFVHDAAAGTTTLAATFTKGVMRFVGGRTGAPTGSVSIETPFGSLGLDKAVADLDLGGDSGPPHFDMISGADMILRDGERVVARVHVPGYSIVPGEDGAATRRTPPEWRSAIQKSLSRPSGASRARPDYAVVRLSTGRGSS